MRGSHRDRRRRFATCALLHNLIDASYHSVASGDVPSEEDHMSSRLMTQLVVVATLVTLPAVARAQEAVLSGTVTDATGAVMPGVTVRAVHEASGNSFEAVTDPRGTYRTPVRVGAYVITAQLSGFTTVTRRGVDVLVGQTVVVDLRLTLSGVAETVTVTG